MTDPDYSDRPRYIRPPKLGPHHLDTELDPRRYDFQPRPTIANVRYRSARGWTRVGLQHHQAKSARLIGWLTAFGTRERLEAMERRQHANALAALQAFQGLMDPAVQDETTTKPIDMRKPRRAG